MCIGASQKESSEKPKLRSDSMRRCYRLSKGRYSVHWAREGSLGVIGSAWACSEAARARGGSERKIRSPDVSPSEQRAFLLSRVFLSSWKKEGPFLIGKTQDLLSSRWWRAESLPEFAFLGFFPCAKVPCFREAHPDCVKNEVSIYTEMSLVNIC